MKSKQTATAAETRNLFESAGEKQTAQDFKPAPDRITTNFGTLEFVVSSDIDVPEDKVTLRYEFEPTGKADPAHGKGTPGDGKLYINGKLVGAMELPVTLPVLYGIEGLSCGYDFGERVTHRYDAPFTFTGEIDSVTVDLAGELTKDPEAELRRLMAQQ